MYPHKTFIAILVIIVVIGGYLLLKEGRRSGKLKVHFINVGCGDAILIELPDRKKVLIDSGSKEHASHLVDFLKSKNIDEIDTALLTHPHYDHFEGFASVSDEFPINNFYYNGDEKNPHEGYFEVKKKLKEKGIAPVVVQEGTELYPDDKDIYIKILHPQAIEGSTNENALVLWLRYKKVSFLFTSDIQPEQQDRMIELFPEINAADCIQVPHHGGRISKNFSELAKGRILVLSTGANPRGEEKPIKAEIAKLKGTLLYRTDKLGDITFVTDGRKISFVNEK